MMAPAPSSRCSLPKARLSLDCAEASRAIGQPEDIAHAALFLMTNPYVTGQALIVDGGLTL